MFLSFPNPGLYWNFCFRGDYWESSWKISLDTSGVLQIVLPISEWFLDINLKWSPYDFKLKSTFLDLYFFLDEFVTLFYLLFFLSLGILRLGFLIHLNVLYFELYKSFEVKLLNRVLYKIKAKVFTANVFYT